MIEDTKSDVVLDRFLLSIATVIKILNLKLYRASPNGVIWNNWFSYFKQCLSPKGQVKKENY